MLSSLEPESAYSRFQLEPCFLSLHPQLGIACNKTALATHEPFVYLNATLSTMVIHDYTVSDVQIYLGWMKDVNYTDERAGRRRVPRAGHPRLGGAADPGLKAPGFKV